MSLVLAGFCAVNCWVIPKLWAPLLVLRVTVPRPPRGGVKVVRLGPAARTAFRPAAQSGLLLAA
ncbi:MAG: hypothetical protein ACLQU2_22925 [Candidatus Binataceae bacterium]